MTRKLSLDLTKVVHDTRTIAAAATIANAEGQIASVDVRSDLLGAVWAAEELLEALQNLHSRSEAQWREDEQEQRYQRYMDRHRDDSVSSDG